MSVYSGTFAPNPDHAIFTPPDPVAKARTELRLAARVPFTAAHPTTWRSGFRRHLESARGSLHDHIVLAERPDSVLRQAERRTAALAEVAQRQRAEHDTLARQADELLDLSDEAADVTIWQMIDLNERAILLEMALARHHNRLMQLAERPADRELSTEAG